MGRNGYMLTGSLARHGYDWWWHSLVGRQAETGELRPFFIEYFVINPALGGAEPILGQLPVNREAGRKPSYAMLKAGCWGKGTAMQLHNFYGVNDFSAAPDHMEVQIGPHTASDRRLRGAVSLSASEAQAHPEFMSDAGTMSWDLSAEKLLSYSVGPGASYPLRRANAFQMFWHVQGMLTRYQGSIVCNGETFTVTPEESAGYQDKNWGSDYTNPWVWLNCNRFTSRTTGERLALTSLDVGGAQPVLFGRSLPRRLLVIFYHEGERYEFNFSKLHTHPRQHFDCRIGDQEIRWIISAQTLTSRIEIDFVCARETMIRVNYENPAGERNHLHLWNGGYAQGTVKLYRRAYRSETLIDVFEGELGGCEYGEY